MQGKRDAFIYLIAKIVTGIIGVFSITIQTTYITPDVLGDFSLITGFTGILLSVFVGWIGSSSLRYYNSYQKCNIKSFVTTVNVDWVIMLVVVCIITIISSFLFQSIPIKENLLLIIIMLVFTSGMDIYEKMMRAAGHNNAYCMLLMIQSVLNIAIIMFLFHLTKLRIESLFIAKIVTSAVFVFIALGILQVFKNFSIKTNSFEINKLFFNYGFPMVGVWGISWLLNYADRYIIKTFMTSYEVGLYDVSYRFAESSIGLIISAFNLAFFPMMIKCWNEKGKEETCNMMRSVFNYLFMFSVPAFVGVSLLANQFYGTIIDSDYKEAAAVIAISSIGFIFMGINNTLYKLWQLEEKTKVVLYLTILSVVINITTNLFFIPKFGYIAAAITTVVSYVFVTIITTVLLRRRFPISLDFKSFIKQIIASTVMGGFIIVFRENCDNLFKLIAIIVCSVLIYFISLILLGGLKSEIRAIFFRGEIK